LLWLLDVIKPRRLPGACAILNFKQYGG